jgi:dodecin
MNFVRALRRANDDFSNHQLCSSEVDMEQGVYKILEVVGTSEKSWEDAATNAITTASKTLRDLRIAEIMKLDMKVEDGKVVAYRARVSLSFKYEE